MTKAKRITNPRSVRNLVQYQKLSDDEFDEVIAKKDEVDNYKDFEERIKEKLDELELDYDFSDMKINDLQLLRALAQALINLNDLEYRHFSIRTSQGINLDTITLLDRIAKQITDIRSDVSRLQDDLKISRKIRKGDGEESILLFIENMKRKAKEFYEQKMSYILCPKCGMLLATSWVLYPQAKNKITLTCNRPLDNGQLCNTTFSITTEELLNKKGSNRPELLPDSVL